MCLGDLALEPAGHARRVLERDDRTLIRVLDDADTPFQIRIAPATVAENSLRGAFIGSLSAPGAPGVTFRLVDGEGATGNGLVCVRGNRLLVASAIDYETTPSFTVRIRGTDKAGTSAESVLTILVGNVKEKPTISLPASFAATEDTPTALVFPGRPFAVDDAPSSTLLTVTLRVGKGTIRAATADGVSVAGTAKARTFTGTLAGGVTGLVLSKRVPKAWGQGPKQWIICGAAGGAVIGASFVVAALLVHSFRIDRRIVTAGASLLVAWHATSAFVGSHVWAPFNEIGRFKIGRAHV